MLHPHLHHGGLSWLSSYFSPSLSSGVLFLQFGDETRRVHITHELNSLETLHALIVHMFPQKLTAGMLKSPNTAILIKDEARNVFYELEDVRDIQDRSIIKIYRKGAHLCLLFLQHIWPTETSGWDIPPAFNDLAVCHLTLSQHGLMGKRRRQAWSIFKECFLSLVKIRNHKVKDVDRSMWRDERQTYLQIDVTVLFAC